MIFSFFIFFFLAQESTVAMKGGSVQFKSKDNNHNEDVFDVYTLIFGVTISNDGNLRFYKNHHKQKTF